MNKTVKTFVAFALVSTLAGTALFAAPRNRRPEKPAVEREVRRHPEYETMVGKVRETKWGFVTFETDEGQKYILNSTDDPALVSMRDIKVKNGSRLILTGKLDRDSKIFTVTNFGRRNSDTRYYDAK